MEQKEKYVVYTFSMTGLSKKGPRWPIDPYGYGFFDSADEARSAVLQLRKEITDFEGHDESWRTMQIERLEVDPVGAQNLLVPLNEGLDKIVHEWEVVELIH